MGCNQLSKNKYKVITKTIRYKGLLQLRNIKNATNVTKNATENVKNPATNIITTLSFFMLKFSDTIARASIVPKYPGSLNRPHNRIPSILSTNK